MGGGRDTRADVEATCFIRRSPYRSEQARLEAAFADEGPVSPNRCASTPAVESCSGAASQAGKYFYMICRSRGAFTGCLHLGGDSTGSLEILRGQDLP